MDIIEQLELEQIARIEAKRQLPQFSAGDTLRVQVRVTEGKRTRLQAFEGVCIARAGAGLNESFTVRKISYGEGVERVFPMYSPLVEAVEVVRRGKVRRAKLYYMRDRRGKSARIVENTNTRARKLNDAERQALAEEKARIEAEKIAAAEALAAEKAAADAAEAAAAKDSMDEAARAVEMEIDQRFGKVFRYSNDPGRVDEPESDPPKPKEEEEAPKKVEPRPLPPMGEKRDK